MISCRYAAAIAYAAAILIMPAITHYFFAHCRAFFTRDAFASGAIFAIDRHVCRFRY